MSQVSTAKFQELDLSEDSVTESLQILTDENLIKAPVMLGGKIHHVTDYRPSV